jgi:hypothetical protein
MTESLPVTAVLRVSRATFDPSRFAEVDARSTHQAGYLRAAVQQLPGLIHFYATVSPDGSMVQASVWDTEEHSAQLNHLKEMVVIARGEMEEVGVAFTPIVTSSIGWAILPGAASVPATAVARYSHGAFAPDRFEPIDALSTQQADFLVPAIEQLPGLFRYYEAVAPQGEMTHISIWESEEHANQMAALKEMVVTAREQSTAAGVVFDPIVNYPLSWTI